MTAQRRSGHSRLRWAAAPMPEMPAPTMSTSSWSSSMGSLRAMRRCMTAGEGYILVGPWGQRETRMGDGMAHEMNLRGRTALVTGAGSGIGRGLAQVLAARGVRLALADIDEAGLAETASTLPASSAVSTHRLDVADRA